MYQGCSCKSPGHPDHILQEDSGESIEEKFGAASNRLSTKTFTNLSLAQEKSYCNSRAPDHCTSTGKTVKLVITRL